MFLNNYVYKMEYFACSKLKTHKTPLHLLPIELCTSKIFNFIYRIFPHRGALLVCIAQKLSKDIKWSCRDVIASQHDLIFWVRFILS